MDCLVAYAASAGWTVRRSPLSIPKGFLAIVDDIKKIANLHKATPGQVTLAWLMAQGDHVFPIPGTTNLERLKENAGSLNLKLTPEDLEEMTALVKQFKAAGARYPEAMSKNLGY